MMIYTVLIIKQYSFESWTQKASQWKPLLNRKLFIKELIQDLRKYIDMIGSKNKQIISNLINEIEVKVYVYFIKLGKYTTLTKY